jgi:uncharacterized protein
MPRPVHFEIHASQPEEIQAFYSALFGWTFHQWGEQDYWLLATGDGNPMAGIPSSKPGIDDADPDAGPLHRRSPESRAQAAGSQVRSCCVA